MSSDAKGMLKSLVSPRSALAAVFLLLAFTLILVVQGRPWWCKEGPALWSPVWTHCTSQNFLDPYSLSHVLHGVLFYGLLWLCAARLALPWRMVAALALEIGWELLENSAWIIERYRQNTAALDYTGDSVLNSLGDVASALCGFAFAARFNWKASLALFFAFELWLLYLSRDNLTLNVLMLLFPLEAIKQWQTPG